MTVELLVQRSEDRFLTRGPGWTGRFCFSYGEHYDPQNLSFGRLLACNEFVLEPGAGFGPHRHAGVVVVTTVLSGALTHVVGEHRTLHGPGSYVFATGPGAEHDERNEGAGPVRFVQAWLLPGAQPRPQLVPAGEELSVAGPAFVFVGYGEATVWGEVLWTGDSVRSQGSVTVAAGAGATVLVWTA